MSISLRDNLLVTAGGRASDMHELGVINLPSGVDGENELAEFVVKEVDGYLKSVETEDINFDEWIETSLIARYGR